MSMTEKDLQQLLTETKKLACMNNNLKLEIQYYHDIDTEIDKEDLIVLLENNTNFLKYFHDCMYKAIKDGYLSY